MLTSPSFWLVIAIIASAAVIVYIVLGKFPTLSAIDTSDMQDEKQNKLKRDIMADRLYRKLAERLGFVKSVSVPAWRVVKRAIKDLYKNIHTLEKQYRLTRTEKARSSVPTRIVERDILVEAQGYFQEGDLQKAEDAYISLIGYNEQNVAAYEGLAEVYYAKKEYDHAKKTLNFLLQIKGKNVENEPAKKNTRGKKVLSEDEREIALHHFELGEIHEKNGDREKALRSYKEALKLDKNNPKYLDRLIESSIMQRNKLLAQRTLDTLRGVNEDNTKLRDWQRRVDAL